MLTQGNRDSSCELTQPFSSSSSHLWINPVSKTPTKKPRTSEVLQKLSGEKKKKKRGEFPNLTSSCCMPGVPAGLLLRAGSSPPWAQHRWWCCKEGLRARPRHSSPFRNPLSTLQGGSPTHLPALLLPRGPQLKGG